MMNVLEERLERIMIALEESKEDSTIDIAQYIYIQLCNAYESGVDDGKYVNKYNKGS